MKTILYTAITVFVISVALYAGLTGYYYYQDQKAERALNAANAKSSELEMNAAAEAYATLAASETDPVKRARLRTLEGFSRNNAGQYREGIALLKEIVADPNAPGVVKAEALNAMLYVSFRSDLAPLQLIFNDGGIYAEAMAGGNTDSPEDLRVGVSNLYKIANSYFPYAFSQYVLTVRPTHFLFSGVDVSEADKVDARQAIANYVTGADQALSSEMYELNLYESENDNVMKQLFPMAMHIRLRALEALALEDESRREITENYYDFAINIFDGFDTSAHRSIESYLRFYYATYLARVYGESRESEIAAVMTPVYDDPSRESSNTYSIWKFFESELNSASSTEAVHIRTVAEHDSNFKSFLQTKGWLSE